MFASFLALISCTDFTLLLQVPSHHSPHLMASMLRTTVQSVSLQIFILRFGLSHIWNIILLLHWHNLRQVPVLQEISHRYYYRLNCLFIPNFLCIAIKGTYSSSCYYDANWSFFNSYCDCFVFLSSRANLPSPRSLLNWSPYLCWPDIWMHPCKKSSTQYCRASYSLSYVLQLIHCMVLEYGQFVEFCP